MSAKGIKYREDLVTRIRDLIDGYDSSSILKEYLQNSDDSGATEIIVTFDKRTHNKLINTPFVKAMGPALYISNNSVFEENDFKSIVKISAQGKVLDAKTTGRFGQGFSSSFSISDHPSFISNGRVYWFDIRKNAVSKDMNDDILFWDISDKEISIWLDVFQDLDLDNVKKNLGTIFRLPLRDTISIQDKSNKINDEIFSINDFYIWVNEWREKSENLIFLRNIKKLVLQEIDENGKKTVLILLETINNDEINIINNNIQNEFINESLIDTCNKWLMHDLELPYFRYYHKFKVSAYNQKTNKTEISFENWAVVNGLFRGENNILIDQTIKALNISPNPRKVLPWAGAAILLDKNNQPIINKENQFYTFLPLPIKSEMPLHLHGWFDVNPKRTEITYGGTGHDKEVLTEWNQLLMEHAVGVSWAKLIDFIKKDVELKNYYKIWAKDISNGLFKFLSKGFYHEISKNKCFYVNYQNNSSWAYPYEDIHFLRNENDKLFGAFTNHFQIISPKPTDNILKGFSKNDINISEITPLYIRTYLNTYKECLSLPAKLSKLNSSMFSKKEWLLEIVLFCSENGEDLSLLENLPLQLTMDNELNIIGDFSVIIGKNINIELLQNKKEIILDYDLSELIENNSLPYTWLEPNLENFIELWNEYIDELDLNNEWIKLVIDFIYEHRDEINKNIDILKQLPIVRQENSELKCFGIDILNKKPFCLPRKYESYKSIFINNLGINLVHDDLNVIYKKLIPDNLISELTPKTMAQFITLHYPTINFKDNNVREVVISILSDDLSWINEFDEDQMIRFKKVPFICTVSGNLYSISDIKLFISTDFDPPEDIKKLNNDYELINPIDDNEAELYLMLGIEKQTTKIYILNTIIPFLENSSNRDDCISILSWLAIKWDILCETFTENQKEDVLLRLQNSKIIPDRQYVFTRQVASKLYHPSISLPLCLSDNMFYQTINFKNTNMQQKWYIFLNNLNASHNVFPDHIVTKVIQIAKKQDESNYQDSICLVNYIVDKINEFDNLRYGNRTLLDELKKYPWLPVENPNKFLVHPVQKYSKFMQGKNLIRYSDSKLVSGVYYTLNSKINFKNENVEFNPREIAKKLGIKTTLSIDEVCESFRKLTQVDLVNNAELEIIDYALAFYKYLGRHNKLGTDELPIDIKQKAILINKKWIPSNRVFKRDCKLNEIYSWTLISNEIKDEYTEIYLIDGLEILGVRDIPSTEVLVDLLSEIPLNSKLSKENVRQADLLLQMFEDIEDIEDYNIEILSRDNVLMNTGDLYINDLPAYKNAKIKNERLKFCRYKDNKFAKRIGVDSLKDCREGKLNEDKTIFEDNINKGKSDELIDYLRKPHFIEGLLRLFFDENKISEDEIDKYEINETIPTDIIIVKELVVDFLAYGTFIYTDSEATTLESNDTLYILRQEDLDDMIDILSKYICQSKKLSNDSLQYLMRILQKKMNKVKMNIFLDKKGIKELPPQVNLKRESIFYELDEEYYQDGYIEDETFESLTSKINRESNVTSDTRLDDNSDYKVSSTVEDEVIVSFHITGEDESNHQVPSILGDYQSSTQTKNREYNDNIIPPPISPEDSKEGEKASNKTFNSNHSSTSRTSNGQSQQNRSTNSDTISTNDRKPVYVGNEKERDKEKSKGKREEAKKIGDKGENYILSHNTFLLSPSNDFIKAPTNNKGFDILEKDKEGNIIRYIEVKTLTGQWGTGGVGITISQLKFALEHGDKWWLIVVKGINTENVEVFQFKNPVLEATSFMFDNSWKQLSKKVNSSKETNFKRIKETPKKGETYSIKVNETIKLFEITKVKSTSKLLHVWAIGEDDVEIKINFNDSLGRV